jgi:hypothetical protein
LVCADLDHETLGSGLGQDTRVAELR